MTNAAPAQIFAVTTSRWRPEMSGASTSTTGTETSCRASTTRDVGVVERYPARPGRQRHHHPGASFSASASRAPSEPRIGVRVTPAAAP